MIIDSLIDGRMEWSRVLCENNISPEVIARIQKATQKAYHDPKYIDDVIGWRTNNNQ